MVNRTRTVLDLDVTQKKLIERTAVQSGLSLADFARDTLLREAQRVVSSSTDVIFPGSESRRFLNEIDLPFQPNTKLTNALKRVK